LILCHCRLWQLFSCHYVVLSEKPHTTCFAHV